MKRWNINRFFFDMSIFMYCFNINIYKDSYIKYDKVGISTDNNKNTMVSESKTNLQFYRTIPLNNPKIVKYQEKDGMFNPSFQDCAQYGIQSTLMYLFVLIPL